MKESNIDDKLKSIARDSNIDIPQSFNEKFEDTLNSLDNKKYRKTSFKRKYLIASAIFIVILTGVIFTSNPVSAYIDHVFSMLKEDRGLKKAEEKGIIQNLNESDEDKGIEVKVEKMFLDKESIGIFLELTLDKKYRKDFDRISFGKALFKDNNGNAFYYGDNDELYDEEYHKGNLVSKYGRQDNINLDGLKEEGKIKLEYRFGLNLKEIPKEINLDIRNIQLSNKIGAIRQGQKDNNGGKKRVNIDGNWNVTLKVNEDMTKFKDYIFIGESDLIKDIKLSVAPFSSKISFRVNKEIKDADRGNYEPYKLIDNKGNEYDNIYGGYRQEGSNIEAKMESSYFEDVEYFDLKVRIGYDNKKHEYIYETIRLDKQEK